MSRSYRDSLVLCLISCISIQGCGKLPGFAVEEKADTFKQVYERNDKIDILFVVDNSGSMDDNQTTLAASFSAFISHFASKNLKFQIGVTSTDTKLAASWWDGSAVYNAGCNTNNTKPYRHRPATGFGTLLAFDNSMDVISSDPTWRQNDKILSPSVPDYEQRFRENAKLGVCGSGGESGLEAGIEFFNPAKLGLGGANEGFVRNDAFLAVIMVSDEDESIGNGNANYIKYEEDATDPDNYDNPLNKKLIRKTDFVNALKTAKGGKLDRVRFDAIVVKSTTLGNSEYCPQAPFADSIGDVYMEVADELSGKSSNICTDFGPALDSLGEDLVVAATKFKLIQPPNGDIEVVVNGTIIPEDATNGWTYDEANLVVEFHGDAVPPENAEINVNYIPARPI